MRKLPLTILLLLSTLCLKGMADTITLKDGSTIEGKITQETDAQVTISVKVSDTHLRRAHPEQNRHREDR